MLRPLWPLLTLVPFLLHGCTDLRPALPTPQPDNFPTAFSLFTAEPVPTQWWQSFNSQELNTLIEQGLNNNNDLKQAWARLKQAKAIAAKKGAEKYPELDFNGEGIHNRRRDDKGTEATVDSFSLGLSAAYEIDLWGRIRASLESAELTVAAQREDVNAAAFSISAGIADTWVRHINMAQQRLQLQEQLDLNNNLLELIEMRFTMAKANALDVYQQKQTITAIQGGLITVRGNREITRHQLALLTGRPAGTDIGLNQSTYPEITPLPPTGLPADLLARRPDIRAAGLRLRGSAWEIAAARADRLPQLKLTGSFAYNSGVLETFLDSWLLRLAASLTGPIFDGGRRKAEVNRTRAVAEERLAGYRQAVLTAIREVEDSIVREQQFRESLANITTQIELTRMAYREATYRYLNGLSDFLPVLREQINLITTQLDYIQAGNDLLTARINLYKALGGNWTDDLRPPDDIVLSPPVSQQR